MPRSLPVALTVLTMLVVAGAAGGPGAVAAAGVPDAIAAAGGPGALAAADLILETYGHPALEAIGAAYLAGELTEAQAMLYRLYFLKEPDKLPARFRLDGPPIRCATTALMEIYEYAPLAPAAVRQEIEGTRSRPFLPLTRQTTHYLIHYTLTGSDAVPNEAYVDVVANACETAWTTYHTNMTWDVPPSDGTAGGGTDLIDCYIHVLGTGILGLAEPESTVPGGEPYDQTGYFHVDNGISNTSERQVTVVHEYMHVVQFGYYGYQTFAWYMENSAMMGEEYAYDNLNDYRGYLAAFFAVPYKSLKTHNGAYEYGQIVWPMYQTERFGVDVHEEIWADAAYTGNMFTTTDNVLAQFGYNLASAYREFMIWCFYTNQRYDGNHFEEANTWVNMLYPNITMNSYPTGEKHPSSNMIPEALGTSVMKFVPESGDPNNTLVVDFDGPPCTLSVDLIAKTAGVNVWTEYSMILDADGNGQISIPGFNLVDDVFMLTSMQRECNTPQDYLFFADTEMGGVDVADGAQDAVARVYPSAPNPFARHTAIAYRIPSESRVSVQIFDAAGRAVRHLFDGRQPAGRYEVIWDGADDGGATSGNGVYFAHVQVAGQREVTKVTLLR